MEEIYIYHHLGLGDHIICNSIVRNFCDSYDTVYLFVKPHNYKNVEFMYRDLTNITLIKGYDNFCENYIKRKNYIKIGFDELDRSISFDKSFYKQSNLHFEMKWSDFHIERDYEKENKLYRELINIEYIFVHDDIDRGFKVREDLLPKDIKIIRPSMEYDFFDYCKIIENAKEIHLMESSYKCLVEHLNIKSKRLFYHTYIRNYPKNIRVSSKYNWIEY
jgi:hypothetical protein